MQAKQEAIEAEKKVVHLLQSGSRSQKCEDVQLLKFGRTIDLSVLEKVTDDPGTVELREKLKRFALGASARVTPAQARTSERPQNGRMGPQDT